jgi:hypothetical protein
MSGAKELGVFEPHWVKKRRNMVQNAEIKVTLENFMISPKLTDCVKKLDCLTV